MLIIRKTDAMEKVLVVFILVSAVAVDQGNAQFRPPAQRLTTPNFRPGRTTFFPRPSLPSVSGQQGLRTTTRRPTMPTRTQRPTLSPKLTTLKFRKTTTAPTAWDTSKLNKGDQKKLSGAFDPNAQTQFTGGAMFDASGNISKAFLDIFDQKEKDAVDDLQNKYGDVMDLTDMYQDKMPEDIQFFIQMFGNMDDRKLDKFVNTPDQIAPRDLKGFPLEVFAAMNETVRDDKMARLQPQVVDAICNKLQDGDTDYDTTKTIDKSLDCTASLQRSGKKPSGNLKEAIAKNKLEKKPVGQWTDMDWQDAIRKGYFSGLPDGAIDKVPPRVVKDNADRLAQIIDDMDSKTKDKVFSKMQSAAGGFGNMSATELANMGSLVKDMSMKEMKQMNASAVKDSIGTFRDNAKDMSRAQKSQIKRLMKENLGSADSWSANDIVDAATFIAKDRSFMKNVNKSDIVSKVTDIGSQDLDVKGARSIAKKLRESSDYDDPADFDTSKFRDMGKIATGFQPRFIKNMTNVDFGSLLSAGDLKDMDFDGDSSRALIDRVKSDAGKTKLDKSDLENLGKNVKGLRKADVDSMTADDLADSLQSMNDTFDQIIDEMDKVTIDGIIQKIESATGGLGAQLDTMGSFAQKIPVQKLKNLTDSDFGDMSGDTKREINCSATNCPVFYEKVTQNIGRPGLKNPNMTLTVFRNLGKVMCGMTLDDLRMLPATSSLEGIVSHLTSLKCLSDYQERILAEKIKYRLGLFGNTVRTLRRQDIKNIAGVLKHFSKADLERFGQGSCDDIAVELGSQDLSNVKKDDLQSLAKFVLECRNKSKGALDSDDMSSLGDLACGLDQKRIKDIDSDAMQDAANNAQDKCVMLGSAERKEWAKQAMDKMNITKDTMKDADDVTLVQLGTFLGDMDDKVRDQINTDALSSAGADLVDQFAEKKKRADDRVDKGFGNDVSTKDKKDADKKELKVFTAIKDSFVSTSRRRKRSVSSLSCDDMKLLGSGVTSLTTSEIEAMSDSDFLDCASFLGGFSTWTDSQLQSLLSVATRSATYGATSGWTADHLYSAGIIAQGLTSSELSVLTDLSDDAMYSIGRHDGWEEDQLSSGFSRWLSLNKGSDASTVTSTELIALGHFVCGASTGHIMSMSSTAYSLSASYVGELTSCDEGQMEQFIVHALAAFGSLDTWDTSVISSVGTMIGGLTANDLSTLTNTQIAAIEPTAISLIPSATFVGFSVSQLSSFSVAQAQATTANQQAGLSSAQLDALISAGATDLTSSAGDLKVPFTLVLFVAGLSTLSPRFI